VPPALSVECSLKPFKEGTEKVLNAASAGAYRVRPVVPRREHKQGVRASAARNSTDSVLDSIVHGTCRNIRKDVSV